MHLAHFTLFLSINTQHERRQVKINSISNMIQFSFRVTTKKNVIHRATNKQFFLLDSKCSELLSNMWMIPKQ